MNETTELLKKQLLWTKITAGLFGAMTCMLLAAVLMLAGFISKIDTLADRADSMLASLEGVAVQLNSASEQLSNMDWETLGTNTEKIASDLSQIDWKNMADKAETLMESFDSVASRLEDTSEQLSDVDWATLGANMENIASDLSAVDWQSLTEDIGDVAVKAEESLDIAEKAIADAEDKLNKVNFETLSQAIEDFKNVIDPLSSAVSKLKKLLGN